MEPYSVLDNMARKAAADTASKQVPHHKVSGVTKLDVAGLQLHPASLMFPEMPEVQFLQLKEDIKAHGLKQLIVVDSQMRIIDGRHRFKACEKLGHASIDARIVDWSDEAIYAFALSENLHRRHLSTTEKALVAARLQLAQPIGGMTDSQAATRMNVGERSITRAKAIETKGCPKLRELVANGTVSLGAAAELTRLPHHEQEETIALGAAAVRAQAKRLRRRTGKKWESPFTDAEKHEHELEYLRQDYLALSTDMRRMFLSRICKELPNLTWEHERDEIARLAREAAATARSSSGKCSGQGETPDGSAE